jgi:hypothetical protein
LDILPGSQLWDDLSGEFTVDWRRHSYQEASWIPDTIEEKDLIQAQPRAFREFFLRPKPLFFLLRYFKFSQLPFIFKRVKDFKIFSLPKAAERGN